MSKESFKEALTKSVPDAVPLYCTGYPDQEFMFHFLERYDLPIEQGSDLILNKKNYSLIARMGFDAISLWDYRRGPGGYRLNNDLRVDGWGRIYKGNWYQNDGVFKDKEILKEWKHLCLPPQKDLNHLQSILPGLEKLIVPVLSIPGLFEKTWQSMGLRSFSRYLLTNIDYLHQVVDFFYQYVMNLLPALIEAGVQYFLIADDCGYKQRTFLSPQYYRDLFANPYISLVRYIHDQGGRVILHSDGNITDFVEIFINLGFDGLQSLEPNAGVDIFSLFQQYNSQICFIGNLDVSTLLYYGTPSQIIDYVNHLIIKSRESCSPLIISPTQQISIHIDPANIRALIDATKNRKE